MLAFLVARTALCCSGDISGSTYSCTYLYLVVPATTERQAGAVQESVQKRSPSIFMPSTQRRQFSRLRNVCAIPVSRARAICFPSANLFVQIIFVTKLFAMPTASNRGFIFWPASTTSASIRIQYLPISYHVQPDPIHFLLRPPPQQD